MKVLAGLTVALSISMVALTGCQLDNTPDANYKEMEYQKQLMDQSSTKVGNPEITEYFEKKLAKEIFELRDKSDLVCYAYTHNDMSGKYVFLGRTMGYGLPYSTQYTNPQKFIDDPNGDMTVGSVVIPQAEPNGLYSSDGLSATWLWLIDEETGKPNISYIEQGIFVSQHKLPKRLCEDWSLTENY